MIQDDTNIHREAILTNKFTRWLSINRDYNELFDDQNTAVSDPFDSGGLIGHRLIFIEYKNRIHAGQISYAGSKGSSLEKKTGQLLKLIYRGIASKTYNAVAQYCPPSQVPHLIFASNGIGQEALTKLREMLTKRAKEWMFSFEVSVWSDDGGVQVLAKGGLDRFLSKIEDIKIPDFPSTAPKRKPNLNRIDLEMLFTESGCSEEFNALQSAVSRHHGKFTYRITGANIKFPKVSSSSIIGLWPHHSTVNDGMLISINLKALSSDFGTDVEEISSLGLTRAKEKIGHLGFNMYCKGVNDVKKLVRLVSDVS